MRLGGWVLGLSSILGFGLSVSCGATPRIVCREPEYDFGTVPSTSEVRHAFIIYNEGDAPLQFGRLHACCGGSLRTTVTNLPAGANTEVWATLSLRGRRGPQRKSYYLGSNDPGTPHVQLQFRGTVTAADEPIAVDFGMLDLEAATQKEVRITSGPGILFSVTGVVSCVTGVVGVASNAAPAEAHSILIRTTPPLPVGALRGAVRVLTDCPKMPVVEVAVRGVVASDLLMVPSEIVLGLAAGPEAVTRYVAVWSRTGRPFRILRAAPPAAGMQVEQQPLPTGGYRLALRGIQPSKDLNNASLRIVTDHPSAPDVVVPFRVIPAETAPTKP